MITLPAFICMTQSSINSVGGDGNVVYRPAASSAMIICYQLIMEYCRIRRLKNPVYPIAIVNKLSENHETYTQFKFPQSNLNLDSIYKAISNLGFENTVQVSSFTDTINIEVLI